LSDRIRGIVGGRAVEPRILPESRPNPESGSTPESRPNPESRIPNPESLALLGGNWRNDCFVVERRFDASTRHGHDTVGTLAELVDRASPEACWFAGGAPARPPFVFVDLETTGLDPSRDEVIELGVLFVESGRPTRRLSRFFAASRPIPVEAPMTTTTCWWTGFNLGSGTWPRYPPPGVAKAG
jgi:hypothetical protein